MMILEHTYEDKNGFGKRPFLGSVGPNIRESRHCKPIVAILLLSWEVDSCEVTSIVMSPQLADDVTGCEWETKQPWVHGDFFVGCCGVIWTWGNSDH